MKRLLSVCLVLLLLLSGCAGKAPEKPENPLRLHAMLYEYYNADNAVYQTEEITYTYSPEGIRNGGSGVIKEGDKVVSEYTYEFDEYGNELRKVSTTGEVIEWKLTLNDNHRPIRKEQYIDGQLRSVTEQSFDKAGHETRLFISRVMPDMPNADSEILREFDKEGNLIRVDTSWDDTPYGYELYHYTDGKLTQVTGYDATDALVAQVDFTYDESGQLSLENHQDFSSGVRQEVRCTYSEEICTRETTVFPPDGADPFRSRVDRIDPWGNLLMTENMQGERMALRLTYTYEPIP